MKDAGFNFNEKMKQLVKIIINVLVVYVIAVLTIMSSAGANEVVVHVHTDIFGSPLAATDEQGKLLWRESYKPYGERLDTDPGIKRNEVWYTSRPYDDETGLSFMGARDYDPLIGRFYGVYPVGFKEDNMHLFNRYAYANNNPYKHVDRDGMYAELGLELLSLSIGIDSAIREYMQGDYWAASADALGAAGDTFLATIPVAPGVIGITR